MDKKQSLLKHHITYFYPLQRKQSYTFEALCFCSFQEVFVKVLFPTNFP